MCNCPYHLQANDLLLGRKKYLLLFYYYYYHLIFITISVQMAWYQAPKRRLSTDDTILIEEKQNKLILNIEKVKCISLSMSHFSLFVAISLYLTLSLSLHPSERHHPYRGETE